MKTRVVNAQWRVDDDGMLRVTARILAEGVFDYGQEDSPEGAKQNEKGRVAHYIPKSEFTEEALHTLEGKPVIIKSHVWRDSENTMRDGLTVGAVAGKPIAKDGYIEVDFVISDKDTIDKIKSGELVEVSAAYDGDCSAENGTYKGMQYGAVQRNLRFNHVLLLPKGSGRCGHDVRIVNNKPKENRMLSIQRQFGNRRVDFKFTNEADAKEAENMAEEERKFNATELEDAMARAKELKAQMEALEQEYEAAMSTIEEQKQQIDDLMSAETQEALAQEAAAQTEAEEAILDDAIENEVIEEEEKEEVKKELKNCKSFADRRRVVVQNAMQVTEKDMQSWDQNAIDGSFETLNRMALMNSKKRAAKVPMGGVKGRYNNAEEGSPLSRILRPMKMANAKTTGKGE